MTIQEMHTAIAIELDKSGSLTYPSFLTSEIDYWLNAAQLKEVKDTLFGSRSNPTSLKNSMSNIEDLRTLMTSPSDTPLLLDQANMGYVDLQSDFLHFNEAIVLDSASAVYPAKIIDPANKFKYLDSPINSPWIESPLVFIEEDRVGVIVDTLVPTLTPMTSNKLRYSYYKIPTDVAYGTSTSSELPTSMHQRIVELAANLMLENIESPRFPNNTQLINDTL